MKAFSVVVTAVACLATGRAELLVTGEGKEQLGAVDIADVENIAAEIMPGRRLAAVRCFVSDRSDHHLSLLHVYAEPHEQTPRVWHGLQFKCVREDDYHPPIMGPGANEETRRANLTIHKRGRWIAEHADPVSHYGVIVPAGSTLPIFPSGFLDRYLPSDFGRTTAIEDALAVYDFLAEAASRVGDPQTFPDVTNQPIRFIQATGANADVVVGKFKLILTRTDSQWRIAKTQKYGGP